MDWLKLMMDIDDENKTIRNCFMAVVSEFIEFIEE
jgi:hypothetical protein